MKRALWFWAEWERQRGATEARRMSVRKTPEVALSVRQKLTMFHGTGLSAETVLGTEDDAINFELMLKNAVKALNLTTAGVRPLELKRRGVATAAQLRRLGYDALHLVDPVTCNEASAAYGAVEVVQSFLCTPSDAVALAGSEAVATLNISVEQLLSACAGAPTEALSVLQQVTCEAPLRGCAASVLLDSGLRAPQLKQLGYGLATLRGLSGLGGGDLSKLGFSCV